MVLGKDKDRSKRPPYSFPAHALARWRRDQAILENFGVIEKARTDMQTATIEMLRLIAQDREWTERWEAFLAAGGVTCRELAHFMIRNPPRRFRPIRRRGHLRCVSSVAEADLLRFDDEPDDLIA